ncbi:MAG: transcription termination/antitermination protein NusA [Candidatus Omnitrophica bacterium]|nr:transcription termination/antitermination protein NusA [Candidatus Omnitrophota bacterium]
MNGELLSILEAIERDKGIDREILIQAIEAAVATAAKKSEGVAEEIESTAVLDRKTGRIVATVGGREVDSARLTRIAAQTAKQVIIQKIREAERDVIFTEFQGRVGDIVTGSVHRFERGDIIVELGRAEAILPKTERIPHEEYHQGDRVQGYVLEVRKSAKGPSIVLSRTHEGFIRGLFMLEVPEIAEGIVEIKGIAREAGDRTKIAVASTDDKVDCVGACVGMRGTRVKNIVRELHGEKVDIIRWHEHVKEFIAAALSPAKISEIQEQAGTKSALVIVDDDQLSLAIGKKGQNVRLASKLTGWQLEIKSKSQLSQAVVSLSGLPGVGPAMEQRLNEAGMTTIQQLAAMTLEQLTAIKGVGEKTAQKLLESAQATLAAQQAAHAKESPAPSSDEGQAETPAADETAPPEVPQQDASDAGETKEGQG